MVGQSGSDSVAFQNISSIMAVSPQNTGYPKPPWDTHSNFALTKKSCDLSFWVSVRSTAKKKDERAVLKEQERVYAPDGETVPVYIRAPKLSYKSYLVSARSTPGILLPVKQEDLYPTSQCCSMFLGCLLVLRPKSLEGKAKTFRYLQRSCLLPRGLLGVRLQKPQPMATLSQQDGAGKGRGGKEKPIVLENHSSRDQSSI